MRGFLSGLVWGGLLSAAGLVSLSLLMRPPPPPEVVQSPPDLTGTAGATVPALSTGLPATDPEVTLAAPAEPAVPEPDTPADPSEEAVRARAPVVEGTEPDRPAPPAGPVPRADLAAPDRESLRDAPRTAIRPFPPPSGEPGAEADLSVNERPRVGSRVDELAPVSDEPAPEIVADPAPALPRGPVRIDPPDAGRGPSSAPAARAGGATPEAVTEPPAERARIAALPQAGIDSTASPSIGTPVAPLTERSEQVEEELEKTVPFQAFAADFQSDGEQPLMAIVLIDDAATSVGAALGAFPYPVTLAVDPTAPGAADRAARHRAAGHEVVALIDLPQAATAQDTEVLLTAGLARLPETVALIEGTRSGIQGNRDMSRQVTEVARASGRGLITQPSGLNTVQKLALRDGVPSAVVFRDLDGAGQTAEQIRQVLDRAAFRAGQEGGVVVLGRLRPETISALVLWGLQDRTGRVAVAPVSAVLRRAAGAE